MSRAGKTGQELLTLLKVLLERKARVPNLKLSIKAAMEKDRAPNLTIEIGPAIAGTAQPSSRRSPSVL